MVVRALPRKRNVQRDAQRPDVRLGGRTVVLVVIDRRLWRREAWAANVQRRAAAAQRRHHGTGEAKVGQLDRSVLREEDVVLLHGFVGHASGVEGGKASEDRPGHVGEA